jgi:hypothetical protein
MPASPSTYDVGSGEIVGARRFVCTCSGVGTADGQHVFHSGYERAIGLRRDDPVLAMGGAAIRPILSDAECHLADFGNSEKQLFG